MPKIEEKLAQTTDLRFKDYLFADFSKVKSERSALTQIERFIEKMKDSAKIKNILQIQVKFPFRWDKFGQELENCGFKKGLYFVTKKASPTKATLPENVVETRNIFDVRQQLMMQQKLHYDFNPQFFCSLKSFDINGYLADIQALIEKKEAIAYCKRENQHILGFIVVEKEKRQSYISELFVEEKYRGLGIGKVLMSAVEDFAGHTPLVTSLAVQNMNAMAFYKRCNFVETDRLYYLYLI